MTDVQKLKALFDKLGSDDAFRARLEADPKAALAELGVHVPDGLPTGTIRLPSKEEVQANSAQWLSHAEGTPTAMAMFFFLK
ncbi:NHLP-related RiPP peptide [Pseudomarimonas salicorniae]|uniref:NHLP-related RiPP peptide n=1 Tax=Pseudomarimonas salicorniae TaxID=2933270 RepID=A0ABT0GGL7_9GAMM|nr:NHLP-related RiPP peptide [Lysobacter sp. CAU 1642]MCK7593202.1 NHLP-related RiPP peptide [Lysobacter sp. CAU 1642]